MQRLKPSLKIFLFCMSLGFLFLGLCAMAAAWNALSAGAGATVEIVGLSLVFCIPSIIVLGLLIKAYCGSLWLKWNGISAKATITDISDVRETHSYHGQPYEFTIHYCFISQDGLEIRARRTIPGRIGEGWKINDQVNVLYDPKNADNNLLVY